MSSGHGVNKTVLVQHVPLTQRASYLLHFQMTSFGLGFGSVRACAPGEAFSAPAGHQWTMMVTDHHKPLK